MNDDLNLIVTILTVNNDMAKIAIGIPHGLNSPDWEDYKYFNEPEVFKKYRNIMPMYCATYMTKILDIEEIFTIVHAKENKAKK